MGPISDDSNWENPTIERSDTSYSHWWEYIGEDIRYSVSFSCDEYLAMSVGHDGRSRLTEWGLQVDSFYLRWTELVRPNEPEEASLEYWWENIFKDKEWSPMDLTKL